MGIGIVELITLLMGISGFSVGVNPTAPTPQAALEYAMPDADVVAYVDVGAIVPGNYKVLTNLANQPAIKSSPELARQVKKLVAQVDGPRGLVKGMTGIDLTTDVSDVTASFKVVPKADPDFVLAVHGKFNATTIDKIAKVAGKPSVKAGGAAWFDAGDGNAVGVTKNGVLLAGTTKLVQDRMADAWKAPVLATGTNLGNAADVLSGKPVLAVVIGLSATARQQALDAHGPGQDFLTDAIKRHKLWSVSVHKDGIGWAWIDSTKGGLDAMAQMSDGAVDILRAAQIAPRGFAKIMLGALDSYKGNKQVDELIRHKADLMKIVAAYTGDGQFKAQIDKDPKTLKLSVRLTGASLSEVVPLGGLLPGGALAWFMLRSSDPAPMQVVAPPLPPPPPPAKKQGGAPKHP